jgi:hypothetical protein
MNYGTTKIRHKSFNEKRFKTNVHHHSHIQGMVDYEL